MTQQEHADLQRNTAIMHAVVETAATPIVTISSQGIIRSFNPAAERMFGYQADEAIGQNVSLLMPYPYRAEHDGYLARYRQTGIPHIIGTGREVVCLRKNGNTFPAELAISELSVEGEQLFVGILTDISERKRMEYELVTHRQALEEQVAIQTAEVRAIVQTAVNAVITINERGLIKIFNPAAELMFGYRAEEVVGRNVALLMPEPYCSEHDSYIANFVQTGVKKIIGLGREVVGLRKDGTTFPMYLAVGQAALQNGKNMFVAFASDISEFKRVQEHLSEAKEAAEAGARVKAAFIANMSHEIRTPMNAILGFAEVVLQDGSLLPETKKHVRTIYNSANSLLVILNDILDISKMESGKFCLENVCFHLPNMLDEAIHTLVHAAEERNLSMRFHYDDNLPQRFQGDPTRLRQVVLNLLSNAIKFTEKGGISLTVEPCRFQPDMLHFIVEDSGIGMSQEQADKIFDAFSQADSSTTRRFGGTGLGTTISKQIVELMGGDIWVESCLGQGSRFHFTANLAVDDETESCLFDGEEVSSQSYMSPRVFKILLAEDIETNATLVWLRLEQLGHSVYWVRNGRDAVEAYRDGRYDLILMDVQMPEMDGLDATRAIRELEKGDGRRIPILALTASVMVEESYQCLASGMDGVVAKPIDFSELLQMMERIVPADSGSARVTLFFDTLEHSAIDFTPLKQVVNYAKGLVNWRNALEYAKALHTFAHERRNDAEKIADCLSGSPNNIADARRITHSLKGLAGNLAIDHLVDSATGLDSALKAGRLTAIGSLLSNLHDDLTKTVSAIENLRLPIEDKQQLSKPFDGQAVGRLLSELDAALYSLDPGVVEPLLHGLEHYMGEDELKPIYKSVDRFDFEGAHRQTHQLKIKFGLHEIGE